MDDVFNYRSDAIQATNEKSRLKSTHVNGVVGKIRFVPAHHGDNESKHKFADIFGAQNIGLMRLSSAGPPSENSPIITNMGLKFLIDGKESKNTVAMWEAPDAK